MLIACSHQLGRLIFIFTLVTEIAVEAGMYADVYRSWQQHLFNFNLADRETQTPGLRKPQLAALYATLGHLVMAPATAATIVMPTGTGKTDTMHGLLISRQLPRTLVLVPFDPLRSQLVEKCLELKKLREIGSVSVSAHQERVGLGCESHYQHLN